jgi:2-polyprenyl-3-methyl-5-hydroxy-6-metoxy-1,4-benzoquinol methylase
MIRDDQFSRQAPPGFAGAKELHADDVEALVVEAASPQPSDRAIDLACGPGSVACALARRAGHVVGLDATSAMLEKAHDLAVREGVGNVEWRVGDVYQTPFVEGSFDAVTCRSRRQGRIRRTNSRMPSYGSSIYSRKIPAT